MANNNQQKTGVLIGINWEQIHSLSDDKRQGDRML